jgi:UDP-3-O-[3-hydroxymyristoyl] glucosamine N-acyltransferase
MTRPTACFTLAEIAERFDLDLRGDGAHEISTIGSLSGAGPEAVTFLANVAYRPKLKTTRAGAVILDPEHAASCPVACLLSDDPYLAYARVATLFDTRPRGEPGIHPAASVHPDATLGAQVHVGANAVIGAGCDIGDGCSIGPGCVLAENCTVGAGSRLSANVTLCDGVQLGRRVLIHPGAVIGADGFGIALAGDHWEKVPQLGSVVVGDDCEIGANSCIDRGAVGNTVLEEDVRLDNLCQIGHNCHIGAHTAMAAYAAIAGSAKIGKFCLFAGRSGAHGHIEVADRTTAGAMTMIRKTVTEPGTTWYAGIPGQPIREWQRILGHLKRMDKTLRRVREIDQRTRRGKDDE